MSLPIIEQAKIQAQVLVPLVLCSWRWESSGQTPLFGRPWETCIAVTAKNFGGPRAKRTLARPWRLRLQPSRAGMRSIIKCANNHKMSSQLTSRDAGMPSSTRSWESRSWGSFLMAEGFGPDITLTRTQTFMQGASHCNFRYNRQSDLD